VKKNKKKKVHFPHARPKTPQPRGGERPILSEKRKTSRGETIHVGVTPGKSFSF